MNWHTRQLYNQSFGDDIADSISNHAGSWWSVWLHAVWFLLWFDLALDVNLLTLLVSLEAIFLCLFLLMSGNRQNERDRHQAEADYRVNKEAKADIEELMVVLARLETEKLDKILALLVAPALEDRKSTKAKHTR